MAETARSNEMAVGYRATRRYEGRGLLPLGGVLALASAALLGWYFIDARREADLGQAAVATPRAAQTGPGSALAAPVAAAAASFIDSAVVLEFDGKAIQTTWKALGVVVDDESVAVEASRLTSAGKRPEDVPANFYASAGSRVPIRLDRARALEVLVTYQDTHGRLPVDAHVDLDNRKVLPEQPGFGINVYESLAGLEEAARGGLVRVELSGRELKPRVTRAGLGDIDISTVMGSFETKFAAGERDRNHNLKLAASKVNGYILMPGEEFSFNQVVGDRTEKQGYRVAHVITAGEMVDGLAGGACQVSSTLHGAAYFAGLDIVFSTPHSRPSAYITMGLDATVVYPTTDLKLRNPYQFPVAFKYTVAQGTMRVEVLGRPRPYEKVEFERSITEETPFETITREDDTMPVGSSMTEQAGFPGYKMIRHRNFYQGGEVVKSDKWNIRYPPTTEYVRIGTNPDPNLAPPPPAKPHGPQAPSGRTYTMSQ